MATTKSLTIFNLTKIPGFVILFYDFKIKSDFFSKEEFKMSEALKTRARLMDIAQIIADNSGERIVLFFNEEDDSKSHNPDAGHFLKLDNNRFGRDIETYGLMTKMIGWDGTLVYILIEIIMPLRGLGLEQSYQMAAEKLKHLGYEKLTQDQIDTWNKIFQNLP